ncbi:hypothetical protein [Natronococcus roseus]|uniref:hypothetical protein n=1 Tax=Natronococcus roseus TaxID=1052014 RepID=UPI00374C9D39
MTIDRTSPTRRKLLAASGSLAVLGLAGCVGDDDEDDGAGADDGDDDQDDHDDDHDDDDHHMEVEEFELLDHESGEQLAYVHDDHWDHGPLYVPLEDAVAVEAHVEDADGEEIAFGEDEEYQLEAEIVEGAEENVEIESHGDHVELTGEEEGITELVFQIWHDDHSDWDSPELEVEVVEEFDADENHADDDHHDDDPDHDHDDHADDDHADDDHHDDDHHDDDH